MTVQRHNPAYRLASNVLLIKLKEKSPLTSIPTKSVQEPMVPWKHLSEDFLYTFIYSIYIFPHNTDNDKLGFQGLSIQIHDQDLAQ